MKPKTFLTIIVMLLALFNSESAQAQRLVIWQKDGSKFSYNLDEEPMTTFTATNLVITTKTTTISYPLSTIHRYTYEGVPSGVDDATATSSSDDGSDFPVACECAVIIEYVFSQHSHSSFWSVG